MNTAELHANLRANFMCVDGPPTAYFEIPLENSAMGPGDFILHRFVYKSCIVMMRGEPDNIGPLLCSWIWQRFLGHWPQEVIEDRNVLIFWRSCAESDVGR